MPNQVELQTGDNTRLLIRSWENAAGRMLVTVAPQYMDRTGAWKLSHSGLILAPDVARELGPVLTATADAIEAGALEPEPTATDNKALPTEGSPA
jgi:hypothetical protein